MITEIGITAGEIWHYLEKHERATLRELVQGIGKSEKIILMSLGWLAREGHVNLSGDNEEYVAQLTAAH